MKKRVVKMGFPDVPQEVKLCHAKGALYLLIMVDQEGVVKNVKYISGINHSICRRLREYVEQTVANWEFKPLKIKKEKVSFKGVIEVPFCYGSFGSC